MTVGKTEDKRVKISVVEETPEVTSEDISKSDIVENTLENSKNDKDKKDLPEKENLFKNTVEEKSIIHKNDDVEKHTNVYSDNSKEKMSFWVMFFAFLIGLSLGAGLIGGLFYFKSRVDKLNITDVESSPSSNVSDADISENSPQPTPIESPNIKEDLSKYSVQVLNGSGISGEASRVKDILLEAGFTNIKTGNASKYDYQETEISLKSGLDTSLIKTVTNYLDKYSTKESATPSSTYDITIIVGSKKE